MSDKQFTVQEVAQHKDDSKGLYIIVDNNVYDVTSKLFPIIPTCRIYHYIRTTS